MGAGASAGEFDAFISYAHGASAEIPAEVQRTLERLGRPWYRRRAVRVFRDDTALSANPGLWASISEALDRSRWLVLLASPGAARSRWVDRELRHWIDRHGTDRVLVAVVDGRWSWDDELGDFAADADAVPPALRGRSAEEPRHIDLTWWDGVADPEARRSRLVERVAELAAPIHGMSKDELVGADLREHQRTIRTAVAGVVVLALLALVASASAFAAVGNARNADRARADSEFRRLVAQSQNAADRDSSLALLLALEAERRRDVPASRSALLRALQSERHLVRVTDVGTRLRDAAVLAGGGVVLSTATGRLRRTGVDGRPVAAASWPARGAGHGGPPFVEVAHDPTRRAGDPLVVARRDTGQVWPVDPRTLRALGPPAQAGGPTFDVASSARLGLVALARTSGEVELWRPGEAAPFRTLPPRAEVDPDVFQPVRLAAAAGWYGTPGEPLEPGDPSAVAFNPVADQLVVVRAGGGVELWPLDGGEPVVLRLDLASRLLAVTSTAQVSFSPDGSQFVVQEPLAPKQLTAVDAATGQVRWTQTVATGVGFLAATFGDDPATVFTVGAGVVEERDAATGAVRSTVGRYSPQEVAALRSGPPGRLTAVDRSGRVSVWRTDGAGPVTQVIPGTDGRAGSVSPDGRRLVVLRGPGPIFYRNEVWSLDPARLEQADVLDGRAEFTDPRRLIAFYDDLTAGSFDLRTGRRSGRSIPFDPTRIVAADVNPRTDLVAVAYSDGSADVFDRRVDRRSVELAGTPYAVATTGDGRLLAGLGPEARLTMTDLATGRPAMRPIRGVVGFAAGDDGRAVVAMEDGTVHVADLRTGRLEPRPFPGRRFASIAPLARDKVVFVATDGTTQLFDTATRTQLGDDFRARLDLGFLGALVTPAGDRLVLDGDEGVEVWDLRPGSWRRAACRLAGRDLTRSEWRDYLPAGEPYRRTCPRREAS